MNIKITGYNTYIKWKNMGYQNISHITIQEKKKTLGNSLQCIIHSANPEAILKGT